MNNDFDVAGALGILYEWINTKPANPKSTLAKLNEFLQIFPVDFKLSPLQQSLIEERESARANRDFSKSDEIRKTLAEQEVEIEDSKGGYFARPKI